MIKKNNNINIFFDMDGVLAQLDLDVMDNMFDEHYFFHRPVYKKGERLINLMLSLFSPENVYIVSKVMSDVTTGEQDKKNWISKHFPTIKEDNVLIMAANLPKSSAIEYFNIPKGDMNILFDDHTPFLKEWAENVENGIGVKVLNGYNNKNKTWINRNGLVI